MTDSNIRPNTKSLPMDIESIKARLRAAGAKIPSGSTSDRGLPTYEGWAAKRN